MSDGIPHVDALSRLDFVEDARNNDDLCESVVHWTKSDLISIEELQSETRREPVLMSVIKRVCSNRWNNCSTAKREFKAVRQCLSVEDGILCKGDLIVHPTCLRSCFMKAVHDDVHWGTIATRNRLKLEVWWPEYTEEVENLREKMCYLCGNKTCIADIHSFVAKRDHSLVSCAYGSRPSARNWLVAHHC